jgi:hexaprenyl-diphosphate synthase
VPTLYVTDAAAIDVTSATANAAAGAAPDETENDDDMSPLPGVPAPLLTPSPCTAALDPSALAPRLAATQWRGDACAPLDALPVATPADKQARLAEIIELIHVASLYHDDVVDESLARRGRPSANAAFGDRLAVRAGVFLLARASTLLSRLRSHAATQLVSTVIDQLVRGEVLQMRDTNANKAGSLHANLAAYITKSYYKTASLIANAAQAAAALAGHGTAVQAAAYEYGKNLGLAFQLVDDVLDFTATAEQLGKPALSDLTQGLATAPLLYAAEQFPALFPMRERRFSAPGDVAFALKCIEEARGIERATELARACGADAVAAALQLPPGLARDALVLMVRRVLTRNS